MPPARRIVVYDDAPVFGGHEMMLARLLTHLAQATGSQTLVLLSGENREHFASLGLEGPMLGALRIEFLPFSNPRRLGNLAALLSPFKIAHVLRRFKEFRPDVVLAAQGGIDTSMIGLLAARLGGYRALSYIPNLNGYQRNSPSWKNRLRDRLNRPFHRVPREFVVIRAGQVAELRDLGFRGKVHVVYNAVDTGKLTVLPKPQAREILGLPREAYLLGLIGRIDLANKGHDVVLDAMRAHAETFAGALFVIVGEGPDQDALLERARSLGLESSLRFLGFRKELSPVYSALDLVVIPSRSEGVPLVMLEAMHYGLPVVATAIDGMAEILPPAWLFPPRNLSAFAKRIESIRKGASSVWDGRTSMLERFSSERFLGGFDSVLR